MRSAHTVPLSLLILWLAIGCGAPGVPPQPPEAPAPSPSTLDARQALPSPSPTQAEARVSPTAPPTRPSPQPSPSPTPRRKVIFPETMGTPMAPSASPSPPRSWPGGFSVAPNWVAFQPMSRGELGGLEPLVWFTDGQRWIGPFALPGGCSPIWFCNPRLIEEQGVTYGCVRDRESRTSQFICLTPLPTKPMPAQPVHEVQCEGDLFAETVRCPSPAGMPVPEIQIPNTLFGNPFFAEEPCEDCWLTVRILTPAGSPAMLAVEGWDRNWGEEEVPWGPKPVFLLVEEGGARARPLIPSEARERAAQELAGEGGGSLEVIGFSPDGRFLLVEDGPAGNAYKEWHVLWIVSWPEGTGVSLAGVGAWLYPEHESANP